MHALDMLEKLEGIDARNLSPLQRILIITDGTLTEILEAAFFEKIHLSKIDQQTIPFTSAPIELVPASNETFLEREILLEGTTSKKNYVYAKSVIALDRLPSLFRNELLNSNTPLGRLWLEHRLETFKEPLEVRHVKANDLAKHFNCKSSDMLLARTYRVTSATRSIMLISEYFPVAYENSAL